MKRKLVLYKVILVLIAVLIPVLVFCMRESALQSRLNDSNWELVQFSMNGEVIALPDDAEITLEISGRRWMGESGVNSYEADLRLRSDGSIVIEQLSGTEMGGPSHLMDLEVVYTGAFGKVKSAKIEGTSLILNGGGATLTYREVLD